MSSVLFSVLPIFILILAGWLIVRTGILTDMVGDALGEFVFKIAVPVLLFRTIAEADFHESSPFRLWFAYFAGVAVTWTAGHLLAVYLFRRDARIGVLAGVSSAFANNVFIGLPLVGSTVGPDGIVALSILLAIHLPIMMIVGTVLMENAERKMGAATKVSLPTILKQVGINLICNPLVIGLLLGLAIHLAGISMPEVAQTVVDQVAGMAGPAALLSLGMALRKYGISGNLGIASVMTALKLILLPAVVWVASHLLGLTPEWTRALVLTSSVPTGINAWLIANRFNVGHSLAASVISLSTALGVISVSIWALLLA